MEMKEEYIPVKEYAKLKGFSLQWVYKLLREGKLEGKKIGSYQLVKVE
jgi:predicted DNA-binding transcriptional regulator AlpA